ARRAVFRPKTERNPLPRNRHLKTTSVVGPTAGSEDVLLGNYNGTPSRWTTVLERIRQKFRSANVLYAPGAPLTETSALLVPASVLRTGGAGSNPGLKAERFNHGVHQGAAVL